MIEDIYKIGKLFDETKQADPSALAENISKDRNYKEVAFICLEKASQQKYKYSGITLSGINKDISSKVLYKKGSANGPNFTLTAKTTKELEKTFNSKILGWFRKYSTNNIFLKEVGGILIENKEIIKTDLLEKKAAYKNGFFISLKISEKGKEKYLLDEKAFQVGLIDNASRPGEISGEGTCSICGEKGMVYGDISPGNYLKFYTVDKPGYIAGGFDKKIAWKNFPVCANCAALLDQGVKYIKNNLNSSIAGISYLLVPSFLLSFDEAEEKRMLERIRIEEEPEAKKMSNTDKMKERSKKEEKVLKRFGEATQKLNLSFIFYAEPLPGVFKVYSILENTIPSNMKKLMESIELTRIQFPFNALQQEGKEFLNLSLYSISLIFKRIEGKDNGGWIPKYLNFVANLLNNNTEEAFNIIRIKRMEYLRNAFNLRNRPKSKSFFEDRTLNILSVDYLINKIKNYKGEAKMIEGNLDFKNLEAIRKISEISDLKDSNLKRACFALGLLCKKIEKAQYRRLKSTPFCDEYKGLSMKLSDLKKLFSKSVEKSNQYGLNTAAIKEYIAENFVEISKNEKLSNDDLNYYFALGLSLFDKLFSNTNKEEER